MTFIVFAAIPFLKGLMREIDKVARAVFTIAPLRQLLKVR